MNARRWQWLLCISLIACGSREDEDLRAWMDKTRHEGHSVPPVLPSALVMSGIVYDPADGTDPFDTKKIYATANAGMAADVTPDLKRPRGPLENFPLSSLRLVGSLRRQGQAVALVEVDKLLYQVRKGDHLGQDQGTVLQIADAAIEIEELVQETPGTWTRRRVELSIREKK